MSKQGKGIEHYLTFLIFFGIFQEASYDLSNRTA